MPTPETQSPTENRRWLLANRPEGAPTPEDFRFDTVPVAEPGPGQMLLRTLYLSLDPYMRGRMSDAPSYAAPVGLGQPMVGQTISTVVTSNRDGFTPGDMVVANAGWQDYALSTDDPVQKLAPGMRPTWGLGILGMPGFTAWYGLVVIGEPKAGETVVVAAATGGVGSVVGQLAKARGCRVVGVAGGPRKCAYSVETLGFDACVDHHAPEFRKLLAAACPDGVDIYFENVGGAVLMGVLPLLNPHARIPLCGVISRYNATGHDPGPDRAMYLMATLLTRRVSLRGFIISEHWNRFGEFLAETLPLVQAGRLQYREDIVQGLENAPRAFIDMLGGGNFGKLLVKVAD